MFDVLDPKTQVLGRHFIEASAGTGKTFAIEKIFARLVLEENFSVEEVLLVTFTRAAARELKERIHANIASLPKCKRVEEVIIEMDRAAVFTIHGFCHRMLTEFAFEAGLTPALPDPDESDWTKDARKAILQVLRSPLEGFDPVQLDLLLRSFGNSIERLTESLIAAREGEALPNFLEMQEQFSAELPPIEAEDLLAALQEASASYKGLANRQGELHPHFVKQVEFFGNGENFSLLLAEETFLHKLSDENRKARAKGELSPLLLRLQESVLPVIEEARSPQNTFLRLAHRVNQELQKSEEGTTSPDELLQKMRSALNKPAFCEAIQKRYRAAIIDEFQDTDVLQWDIFKTLFLNSESFIVVGDPKQSIYSFRGADLKVYFRAKEQMGEKAFATLGTNYRSKKYLLSELNRLFAGAGSWLEEEGLPLNYRTVEAGGDEGGSFNFLRAEKEEDLFPFIANEALKRPFSDIAILVKDRYQAARVETYLAKCRIPVRAKGMVHIAETLSFEFFIDLFAALKGEMRRFLAHPIVGYTDQQIFSSDLTQELARLSYLSALLEEKGISTFLDELLKTPWNGVTLYERLSLEEYGHLMQIADLLLEAKTTDPARRLQEIKKRHLDSDMRYKATRLADENSVTIMTMHMSKGLEFPVVFALNLAAKEARAEAEAMRGLYVALTRGKDCVYFPLLQGKPTLGARFFESVEGEFETIDLASDQPAPFHTEEKNALTQHSFQREFATSYLHSFTSLATKHYTFEGERPEEGELPAGADVGIYLHALLEKTVDEALYQEENFAEQILAMTRAGVYKEHAEEIATMVTRSFAISFDGHNLSEISPASMVTELEFLYPQNEQTRLKGFADLIFEKENRLYLVDWKSNYLGKEKEQYKKKSLEKAMQAHEYFLQAKIYGEALERYAKLMGKELGGIYYFFLRGLKWNEGVYSCVWNP
ncbi:MAG: UvrD-helicase domain-containing protein [Candidatus Algichlamydia australiensis]|nr:UvrD-helicase domain-containing protein [Chlamydiales bacterium]